MKQAAEKLYAGRYNWEYCNLISGNDGEYLQ
jgi:hypothetical protein